MTRLLHPYRFPLAIQLAPLLRPHFWRRSLQQARLHQAGFQAARQKIQTFNYYNYEFNQINRHVLWNKPVAEVQPQCRASVYARTLRTATRRVTSRPVDTAAWRA